MRETITVDGENGTTPDAARIGNLLMSSAVTSSDPVTHKVPEDVKEKLENIFVKTEQICKTAGGSLDDVLKMTFFLPDRALQHHELDEVWFKYFPDNNRRPARYVIIVGEPIVHGEFTAVIGSSK